MTITVLSTRKKFAEGKLGVPDYHYGFSSLDEEISFLKQIISIENYFKTTINIPYEILSDDYDTICYISTLINEGKYTGYDYLSEIKIELTEDIKSAIDEMVNSKFNVSMQADVNLQLFGVQYNILIERTYENVQIENLEKLKQKSRVADVGDVVKVAFVPGNFESMNYIVDTLC